MCVLCVCDHCIRLLLAPQHAHHQIYHIHTAQTPPYQIYIYLYTQTKHLCATRMCLHIVKPDTILTYWTLPYRCYLAKHAINVCVCVFVPAACVGSLTHGQTLTHPNNRINIILCIYCTHTNNRALCTRTHISRIMYVCMCGCWVLLFIRVALRGWPCAF